MRMALLRTLFTKLYYQNRPIVNVDYVKFYRNSFNEIEHYSIFYSK